MLALHWSAVFSWLARMTFGQKLNAFFKSFRFESERPKISESITAAFKISPDPGGKF